MISMIQGAPGRGNEQQLRGIEFAGQVGWSVVLRQGEKLNKPDRHARARPLKSA